MLLRLKDSGLSTQDGRSEVLKSIQNTSRLWEAGHSLERKTEHGLAEADALMGEVKKKSLQLNISHKHTYTLLSLLAFVTPTWSPRKHKSICWAGVLELLSSPSLNTGALLKGRESTTTPEKKRKEEDAFHLHQHPPRFLWSRTWRALCASVNASMPAIDSLEGLDGRSSESYAYACASVIGCRRGRSRALQACWCRDRESFKPKPTKQLDGWRPFGLVTVWVSMEKENRSD